MRHLLILSLMLFLSCGRQEKEPDGLLDEETFIQVLAEAQIIEARMNQELVVEHRGEVPTRRYYAEVFTRFNTDKEQFERTFAYYTSRPEEMKAIYEEVLAELGRRKDMPPTAIDTIPTP